jgi:hypothetical protein
MMRLTDQQRDTGFEILWLTAFHCTCSRALTSLKRLDDAEPLTLEAYT